MFDLWDGKNILLGLDEVLDLCFCKSLLFRHSVEAKHYYWPEEIASTLFEAILEPIGRPHVAVDASRVAVLRAQGQSWASISEKLGIGKGTAQRAFLRLPKNPSVQDVATA